MAEHENDKKRKRQSTGHGKEKSNKRVSIDGVATGKDNLKVEFLDSHALHPVFASSPGLGVPQAAFKAYSKANNGEKESSKPRPASHSVLLRSSDHPKLDYTAHPDSNNHLSHYIAVYDQRSISLKIVPAHAVTLRSTLRSETAEVHEQDAARSFAKKREELGMEFGTKKAKKAIADKTINAITGATGAGVEAAVLDSVKEATDALPVKSEQNDAMLASKPIPKPNLEATQVQDVYPVSHLVPSSEMRLLAVQDWQDAVKANEEVKVSSRFVANHLQIVVGTGMVQKLKALKYLLLLIEFFNALSPSRGGRKVPQRDALKKKLEGWPDTLIDNVRRRFADGGELTKWHVDNLMTHMSAISLYIDDWKTNTYDLREDTRHENKQMNQYLVELGCKVRAPTEKEQAELRINRAQAAQRKVAYLKLPLEFPKPRMPPRRR